MTKYPDSFLQHAAICTSQYDSTCRGLVGELLATRKALRDLLKSGEHEGECTNEGRETEEPCQLHFDACERRELAACELLKGTDA